VKFKYYPHIVLCLIFLGKVSTVSAQKIHFSDTSNKWMTYFYHSQGASNGQQVYYKYCYSDSVVVENGHTYSVLNKGTNGLMLVREEGNKVYIKPLVGDFCGLTVTDPNEFLYFDYDLQVGDTLKMPLITTMAPNAYSIHRVESIDSMIINGTWHKMLHMKVVSGFTGEYIVTEGLGASQGPLVAGYSLNYNGSLICFQNNGNTPLPNLSNCTKLNAVDEPDVIADFFKIAPNPARDNVFISYTGQTKTDFELNVMDISGRRIMHSQFAKDIKLDVGTLQSGIYLIQFMHEGKLIKTHKLNILK
jgi:hypothetical protein